MSLRIFHTAGPGGIIEAHQNWKRNEPCPTEVSITFSSQFEQFCEDIEAEAYLVGYNPRRAILHDGPITLEQRPKPFAGGRGVVYHLSEILYGLSLLVTAVRFRADLAVIDSGTTYYFVTALFRLMGIRVVPVLHNTLWAQSLPPTRPIPRFIAWLNAFFFRHLASAVIGVSPECIRQVEQLAGKGRCPLYQIRAQFLPEMFERIPPPPPFDQRPFQIMFIGRISHNKGAFDILEMAQKIEARAPGQVHWELCGAGPELDELKQQHRELGLESIVNIRGFTPPADQVAVYASSHACIVPTRGSFAEGLAMTAAEAILAGRPLITNPAVPALEILRPACVAARVDDVDSYVEGILKLINNRDYYETLRAACPALATPFYDREQGLTAVLKQVVEAVMKPRHAPAIDRVPS